MTRRSWFRVILCAAGALVTCALLLRFWAAYLSDDQRALAGFVMCAVFAAVAWGNAAAVLPIDADLVSWPATLERGETYVLQLRRDYSQAERAQLVAQVERVQARIGCAFFVLDQNVDLLYQTKGGQA